MANTGITNIYRTFPFNQLSDTARSQLEPGMRIRELGRGEILFRIGETVPNVHYLLAGEICLSDGRGTVFERIQPGEPGEPVLLPATSPSPHLAQTESSVSVLMINLALFSRVMKEHLPDDVDPPEPGFYKPSASEASRPDDAWQDTFLRASGFQQIPRHTLEAIFTRMRPVELKRGEELIRQWNRPDYFYIIAAGRCEVMRDSEILGYSVKLGEYGIGATVGEDALITDRPRNSSVTMLTDGRVMRLDGEDFRTLLQPPLTRAVSITDAKAMVANGATWLDVRAPEDVKGRRRLDNSICIPFPIVRARLFAADPKRTYVAVCNDGLDSAIMAFVMSKYGYETYYLREGYRALRATDLH